MAEHFKLLLLFGAGSIAGFINVNAGGGSSLSLPVLIFLGLDGALANGTNRIAIFLQNIFAVASFRHQKVHQFKQSFKLTVWTLPGAIIGALLAVRLSNLLFQRILGIIMIGIVFSIILSSKKKKNTEITANNKQWMVYPALFGIGFYGGFIQVGVGFLLMAALYHLLKISLVHVNMHKVFIVLIYTLPALVIFVWTGNVNWKYGLVLAAGNSFGAWWGAHVAVKKGEKIIKYILAFAILLMSMRLLRLF
jgi:uncharacterized membrane protein YfcA